MMTEQQLQEIERLDARIECPDCGGMGTLGEIDSDMPEDRCQECDGTGDVARWPYAAALIAEVRQLQQQQAAVQATWVDEVTQAKAERDEWQRKFFAEQKDAVAHAQAANALDEEVQQLTLALTEARRVLRDSRERWEQRTALAEAERDAARHMLTVYGCRDAAGHNEDDCPLCSAEHALLNALAERDALREQVTCGEHERMALVVVADAIRDDRTEARRVLREVLRRSQWKHAAGCYWQHSGAVSEAEDCDCDVMSIKDALAAVLAQEEK